MSKELFYKAGEKLAGSDSIILFNKKTNDVCLILPGQRRKITGFILDIIEDLVLNFNVPIDELVVITGALVLVPWFPGINCTIRVGEAEYNEPKLKLVL